MAQQIKIISEDKLQSECIVWANNTYPQLREFGISHTPNGGMRNKIEGMKFKSLGVRKGFPDLIIIPPNGKIFFIEMKGEKGKQSEDQTRCQEWMTERGVEYYVIRDFESFKKLINEKMEHLQG